VIASQVKIVEQGGLKRSLTLVGAGLPLRGATWGGEQRVRTKFPAGNPEGVQHVLGPTLAPSEFEGMWRTNTLTRSPAKWIDETGSEQVITIASTLVAAFESLAVAGTLLRVTWSTDDGRQVLREGRIGAYSFPFDRFDDVKWKATFAWVSRGPTNQKVAASGRDAVSAGVVADSLQMLSDVATQIARSAVRRSDPTLDLSASNASLGQLEQLTNSFSLPSLTDPTAGFGASVSVGFSASFGAGVSSSTAFGGPGPGFMAGITASVGVSVAGIQSSVAAAQAYGADPVELAAEAAQVAQMAVLQLNATELLMGQVPPELLSAVPRPSSVARAAAYVGSVQVGVRAAGVAATTLARAARRFQAATDLSAAPRDRVTAGDVLATHLAKAGETFASIALRYYGTADRAAVIARANGVPGFRVSPAPGQRLAIPALSASNAATRTA
jgi:hypothetical protein